jgi:hypothetical protein
MKKTAYATHGAVSLPSTKRPGNAIERLLKIDPLKIEHPAFLRPPQEVKSGLEVLLDRIEAIIRTQLDKLQ